MNRKEFDRIMRATFKFRSVGAARGFCNRSRKTWAVLGDDGEFWLTTPANCERLVAAGYEYARF